MKIPAPKQMRDFYPEDMALRNHIEAAWRNASKRAGFQEWDCPIVETLELYKRKSGDEIVDQLYSVSTRGGNDQFAIRPEMTPSLARMVAARQGALPRPVKWFCIARMCRHEQAQRGRLREFFQWNADVLGVAGPIADAEVISVAIDALVELGLSAADVEVRFNSRTLLGALLTGLGLPEERHPAVFAIADKRGKATDEELAKLYAGLGLDDQTTARIRRLLDLSSLDEVKRFVAHEKVPGCEAALAGLDELVSLLADLGKGDFCRFDMGIVRGLAYYTGPVFEMFDRAGKLRAVCGGGRYDRLLELMGGQPMPACGFGMGDVVLGELLKDRNLLPSFRLGLDYQLIPLDDERLSDVIRLTGRIRAAGRSADFAHKAGGLGKAFKKASENGVGKVVLVGGDEWSRGCLKIKDMTTGVESEVPLDRFTP
jgi:histidyl-tRNA synthetase